MVGTAKSTVRPTCSAAASVSGVKRPSQASVPPALSAPKRPSTRPCTWKSGSACTTVSSAVHSQAAASASRSKATLRRVSSAPLGAPVVPEV
ncbi:MAG: hypothetical protein M5U28_40340 [Sandaracinaceae bacterium]|nr:hypothetical protein [Sandaracinaceae bacterium]